MNGANATTSRNMPMIAKPRTASGLRDTRRNHFRPRRRRGAGSTPRGSEGGRCAGSTAGPATAPASCPCRSSVIADPRVDDGVEEVDDDVHDDEADGDEQDGPLHDRVVAREDRVDEQAADAGPREDGLGEHGAG